MAETGSDWEDTRWTNMTKVRLGRVVANGGGKFGNQIDGGTFCRRFVVNGSRVGVKLSCFTDPRAWRN